MYDSSLIYHVQHVEQLGGHRSGNFYDHRQKWGLHSAQREY